MQLLIPQLIKLQVLSFLIELFVLRLSLVHPDTEQHVLKKQTDQVVQHDQHA